MMSVKINNFNFLSEGSFWFFPLPTFLLQTQVGALPLLIAHYLSPTKIKLPTSCCHRRVICRASKFKKVCPYSSYTLSSKSMLTLVSSSSILVYHLLQHAQHFSSTWMTSRMHILDCYSSKGMETNSTGEKAKKEKKDEILIKNYVYTQ